MSWKHKNKDNLGVLAGGVAFAIVNLVGLVIKIIISLIQAKVADAQQPGAFAGFLQQLQANFSGAGWFYLALSVVINFVTGALLVLIYNALIRQRVFAKY